MRKRLGQILIEAGVIDALQLRSALAEAARWGKRVGEVLVARGHCTDQQILEAVAAQLKVGIAPLAETTSIPPHVLRLLPASFARDKQVLPLELDGRSSTLVVAVADPAAYELLDELRFRTGHEVRALAATPGDLADAIEHFYFGSPRHARPVTPVGPAITMPPMHSPPLGADVFEHALDSNSLASREAPAARSSGASGSASRSGERPSDSLLGVPSLNTGAHRPFSVSEGEDDDGGPSELARLRAQVVDLQEKVDRAYQILREAALAHRTLLQDLSERGVIDRAAHARKVQERVSRGDGASS